MPPPLKDGIYNFGSEVNRNFSKNNLKFGAIFELSRERREGERVRDRKKIVGPWWLSSGQYARLMLCSNPADVYKFYSSNCSKKRK